MASDQVGIRNFPNHQCDDLDPSRVWRTVTQDIPLLRDYLEVVALRGCCSCRPRTRNAAFVPAGRFRINICSIATAPRYRSNHITEVLFLTIADGALRIHPVPRDVRPRSGRSSPL